MKKQTSHWATVLDIIDAGLARDVEKVRSYAGVLADRLDEAGEAAIAARVRRVLTSAASSRPPNGATPSTFGPAALAFAPADPESRAALVDEAIPGDEPLVLKPAVAKEIGRFIELQRYVDQFIEEGLATPRTLLLYGPSGVGKNTAARHIAHELKLPLATVRLDAAMSSYLGTTAKNLRSAFEYARRRSAVLFLDEFDALAKMRDDTNEIGELKRIVNSLIQNIDAFPELYVIAATNHEHLLDPAVWRRFDVSIYLPLPGVEERASMLQAFLGREAPDDAALRWVAMMTEGCSGADLRHLAVRARQERVLTPDAPVMHLLIREVWRRFEGEKLDILRPAEEKIALVRFLDSRTGGRLPARTAEELTGIPDSTISRIRRVEGEVIAHG